MPLEVATTINQLDAANPTATDPKSQGDDHLRLLKSTVKATFPNVAGVVTPSHTELNYLTGAVGQIQTGGDLRNLLVNANFAINQRVWLTSAATTVANQATLDRWRVVTLGQGITFGSAAPDRVVSCPAGGLEQAVEAEWVVGGVYTLSWVGTAVGRVNGAIVANGAQTAAIAANTSITVQFSSGTVVRAQLELGTVATPFQRRPPGLELMLCQRDYCKSYPMASPQGTASSPGSDQGYLAVGGAITAKINFPVPMRSVPSVLLWSNNGVAAQWVAFTTGAVATSYAATTTLVTERNATVSVLVAGGEVLSTGQWAAATGF